MFLHKIIKNIGIMLYLFCLLFCICISECFSDSMQHTQSQLQNLCPSILSFSYNALLFGKCRGFYDTTSISFVFDSQGQLLNLFSRSSIERPRNTRKHSQLRT